MIYVLGACAIVGIVFMCVFMFLGIWLFVAALKAFRQQRYNNYILEKIYQKLSKISDSLSSDSSNNYSYLMGEEDFDLKEKNDEIIDNITSFNKHEKSNK